MNWIARWVNRRRLEQELHAELTFHVDASARDLEAAGLPRSEARRQALATFGGLEPVKEAARDARGTRWLDDLLADARYALRAMWHQKTFTAAALLSLVIGIGANTAVYRVVDALIVRPLPIDHPDQVFYLQPVLPKPPGERAPAPKTRYSYPAFRRYQQVLADAGASLAAMTGVARMQVATGARGATETDLDVAQLVSGEWFGLLGVKPAAGRLLTVADDQTSGGAAVAVLSYGDWTRHFGRDPSVIGAVIHVNGLPLTIVGVAAAGFDGFEVGQSVDLWAPVALQRAVRYRVNADIDDADVTQPWALQEGVSWLRLVTRVAPPVRPQSVGAIIAAAVKRDVVASAATLRDPGERALALQRSVRLAPGRRGLSSVRDQYGEAVLVLMATVALLLLVACANLGHLLTARHAARAREFAVRLSIGAGRGRLVRQLLTESLMLALLGGSLSLLVAGTGSRALLALASDGPTALPLDVSFTPTMLLFALALSLLAAVCFGLAPAIRFTRATVHHALTSAGRVVDSAGSARLPLGLALLVAQVALSLALVVGASLFAGTLRNLLTTDPGFQAAHVVTARFDAQTAGYTAATLPALRDRLLARAGALPGAREVAVAMCGTMAGCHSISNIGVPGRPPAFGNGDDVKEDYVDATYFGTLGMTVLAGRGFLDTDAPQTEPVAIVNEAMARYFYGTSQVVGRQFTEDQTFRIVGVVRDSRVNGLRDEVPRMAFYPFSQHPEMPLRNVYIRVQGPVDPAERELRGVIRAVDPGLAVREVVTLADLADRSVARERLVSSLTGTFSLLAVAVAFVGLYGSVSYAVTRRTRELGVRLALGAPRAHVQWIVMRDTLGLVLVGGLVGLALILPSIGLVSSLLYGLSPRDPATIGAALAALATVAIVAALLPATRAARLDPLVALRLE